MPKLKPNIASIEEKVDLDFILKELDSRNVLNHATIVLVGSVARGTETKFSDIDLLIITQAKVAPWIPPAHIQLHFEPRDRFIERLKKGDYFPSWALHFGEVLYDSDGWWQTILADAKLKSIWPDWYAKILHAERRLKMAESVLETEDMDAAQEEYLFAATNLARAVLLRAFVFPLSRAELPQQLRSIGDKALASILESLISEELGIKKLRKIGVALREKLLDLKKKKNLTPP